MITENKSSHPEPPNFRGVFLIIHLSQTTIFIPEIIAYIGTDSLCIPLKAIKDSDMVINDTLSYTAEIRYEASALIPKNQFPVEFGDRIISLSGSNIIFNKNEIELGDFCGDVMLANSDITPLRITKFQWNNPLIDTIIKDGNLIVKGLCVQSLSRLQLFTQTTFELIPNPASSSMDMKITTAETGTFNYKIYNLQGEELKSYTWENNLKDVLQTINLDGFSSGVYKVCLSTQGFKPFQTLSIIK